jgi:hypothetical protein
MKGNGDGMEKKVTVKDVVDILNKLEDVPTDWLHDESIHMSLVKMYNEYLVESEGYPNWTLERYIQDKLEWAKKG